MLPRACADLPPLPATPELNKVRCEEILLRQPSGDGGYWWVKTTKRGLGTTQARAAVARAVGLDPELIGCAGHRDRQADSIQWFSVPAAQCEHPGPLRRAGAHGCMRVLEVTASARPIDLNSVAKLRWQITLKTTGAAGSGVSYVAAKVITDRLRHCGLPNYIGRIDHDHAKWGRMLLAGKRLPGAVSATRTDQRRMLLAAQADLFNRWVGQRISDGLLSTVIAGDVLRSRDGEYLIASDPAPLQARNEAFEATVCGPLLGHGCKPAATLTAAEREAAVFGECGDGGDLPGSRRALRIHPGRIGLDPEPDRLRVNIDLPPDVYLDGLLNELVAATG